MAHEDWGEGPWNSEEDHAAWVDPATDLDCMINRGPSGALCGYVGVGPDHPMHGVHYDQTDYDVHGGLTYSAPCQEGDEICHVPEPGREHDIWWFGFDCVHHLDLAPRMESDMRAMAKRLDKPELIGPLGGKWGRTYRDWAYVTEQVTGLARQLAQVRDDRSV